MTCEICGLNPCACEYVGSLLPGGDFAWLADIVRAQVREPFPHRAACPCPVCWSERSSAWDTFQNAQTEKGSLN
jgi:hypothetical protein